MSRRALVLGAALLVVLAGLGYLLVRDRGDDGADDSDADVELPSGSLAPLTGLAVPDDQLDRLARPALAVKVDNHPDAFPQWGLGDADVVIELRVEGLSRFLAVFHSAEVDEVGPVRSARTSDPDLLAMFGRPLTAWSGANPATRELMRSIEWIQDVSADTLPDAYRRDDRARAPHNLVLDAGAAFAAAEDPVRIPEPIFEYRDEGEPPAGRSVPGAVVTVGLSRSQYVWDEAAGGWSRWSDGIALTDAAHEGSPQVAPANLVVLETAYAPSAADANSPEAVSVGEGRAWVFSDGHLVEGRWSRRDRTAPWELTSDDGTPMQLSPGTTWVAMPGADQPPGTLSDEEAAALRSG